MDIRRLRLFITLADTLSFRATAERLYLSQPAVTRALASWESEIGLKLFHRDRHHVALTSEGTELLERARRILADMDDFAFATHALAGATRETLKVGVYGNGLAELTNEVFSRFRHRYPETTLRIFDADFRRGIGPILSGEYQAALLRAPSRLPELRTTPIFLEPIDALLPSGHPLAATDSLTVEELSDDPWVTFPPSIPGTWAAHWLSDGSGSSDRPGHRPGIGVYARSEYEIHAAIAHQGMVGLLPRSSLRLRPNGGITAVPVRDHEPSTAAVVVPASNTRPAALALASIAAEAAEEHLDTVPDAMLP